VTLQLEGIGYISVEAMVVGLATISQVRSRWPMEMRAVLPALTSFKFVGAIANIWGTLYLGSIPLRASTQQDRHTLPTLLV
jgi:hypothetical protein